MPIDDRTANRSYKLPNAGNFLADDVVRLRDALTAIDADVFARYTKTETDQKLADLINGAPGALDTLNELAAAMGDDPNFAATITNALAGKPGFADVWTRSQADARYVQGVTQIENVFTGNGTQTTFALTQTPPSRESLLVTVDGVVQPVSEYNLSGSALILSEAPASGAKIRVLMLGIAGPVQSASTLSFTPAGTGAVTRTVDSKLKDWVSVKDFGAIGNGVANDTAAIEAAIKAAHLGAVFFPRGNYCFANLSIDLSTGSFASLIGEGSNCTTLTHLGTGNAIAFSGDVSGGLEVSGFTLTGNSNASWTAAPPSIYLPHNTTVGLLFNNILSLRLDDLIVRRCQIGLSFQLCFWVNGANVRSEFNSGDCYSFTAGTNAVLMQNCISNASGGRGYYFDGTYNGNLLSCDSSYCFSGGVVGSSLRAFTANGCYLENNGGKSGSDASNKYAEIVVSTPAAGAVSLTGNACRNTLVTDGDPTAKCYGIIVENSAGYVSIQSNLIATDSSNVAGIYVGSNVASAALKDNSVSATGSGSKNVLALSQNITRHLDAIITTVSSGAPATTYYNANTSNFWSVGLFDQSYSFGSIKGVSIFPGDHTPGSWRLNALEYANGLLQLTSSAVNATSGNIALRFFNANTNANAYYSEVRGIIGDNGFANGVGLGFVVSMPGSGGSSNPTLVSKFDSNGSLYLWNPNSTTLTKVIIGASDSAGAGFRSLSVAN